MIDDETPVVVPATDPLSPSPAPARTRIEAGDPDAAAWQARAADGTIYRNVIEADAATGLIRRFRVDEAGNLVRKDDRWVIDEEQASFTIEPVAA